MAEELEILPYPEMHIGITKCESGFLVRGSQYGGDALRAFSTPEGLIEWLAKELGGGPIVWALTLEVWAGLEGMAPDDLMPVPDQATNPTGYQQALEDNARILIAAHLRRYLKQHPPQPSPKPDDKKPKKGKEEKPKWEAKKE